ncbi:protein kinase domain-containing protein [Trujillonella endophytica]|uniref:non-specific serine/threonine protein kinase n=1 Tax=Trujillonella endophytica TaxID=673521 RepID=A0A1H8VEG4_9ACTN|nr:protein kinase [Trujillella endophytica]SEP13268.1 serine/threonine protein kinase [Trujillella endophytica]
MVEPGRRDVGERYELGRLIASGGMGQVWRGTDVLLGRPVAVKVLRSEYTGDPTFLARFRAEAQHAAALSHPNIAAVFDYGETESEYGETLAYLVMELVEGEPLSAMLRREGRLDADTTLSVLQQTAAALAEAHRVGLVHRDVKPGNILVCPDGSVKITDFGIAWSAGSVPLTRTGQVIGTPQYLSPEQAEGRLATPASDVYALGLVGYECLAGRPAFDGDNAVSIALKQLREDPEPLSAELPSGVRTMIIRALAKDPAARMPDGAAFEAAVVATRAGRPLPDPAEDTGLRAVPLGPPPSGDRDPAGNPPGARRSPPPGRRRASSLLVPVVALLLGAAAAAGVFLAVSEQPPPSPVSAGQTQEVATVVLTAADHVGRPVDDVAAELSALGLSVYRHPEFTDAAPFGAVTRLDPTGRRLDPGDDVDVFYAVPTRERPSRPTGGDDAGDGGVAVVGDDQPLPPGNDQPAPPSTTAGPTASTTTASGTATSAPAGPTGTSTPAEPTGTATPTATATATPTTTAGETTPSTEVDAVP